MQALKHEFRPPKSPARGVLFASGHSGRRYPAEFLRRIRLDSCQIRASEDAFVDLLFDSVPDFGAGLLLSHAPRAFLDVNRAESELDPSLIADLPQRGANPRVAHGLGVIARVVGPGRPIYEGKISRAEAEARIAEIWRPYHAALGAQMAALTGAHGQAVLFDCHSMPSAAGGAEIVLGDRFGFSCAPQVMAEAEAAFEGEGFVVARNHPFAGGYVTHAYGKPARGWHALQIEIRRDLYMDEVEIRPSAGFEAMRAAMTRIAARLVEALGQGPLPLAAE